MPPIQSSFRGTLLTGASVLALSVTGSGAHAQSQSQPGGSATGKPPVITFWIEGALFSTAGGHFNVPSLPGLTAPFLPLDPKGGVEGAGGFDLRWSEVYHFVFDVRYGQSRTSSANTAFRRSFLSFPPGFGTFTATSVGNSSATERESHFVADFMIGRDFSLGIGSSQIDVGIRVADLWASVNEQGNNTFTFYASSGTSMSAGNWNSRTLGVGPRLALIGTIPIAGAWTVDYGAGIAELYATRRFNGSVIGLGGGAANLALNFETAAWILNADASAALSYWITRNYKVSLGIRGDYYGSALTTYSTSGGLENVDRLFWGPFVRFTGSF